LASAWQHADKVARAAAHFAEAAPLVRQAGATCWISPPLAKQCGALFPAGDLAGAVVPLDEAPALVRQVDAGDPLALQDRYGLSQILVPRRRRRCAKS
jgi:hypothetical protein